MANAAESMKEYLKRYQSGAEAEDPSKKKKKKRKKEEKKVMGGVLIVDEDPVWQKPVQIEEPEESESDGEEQPVIQEDIEVRRMKRLEFLRSKHNQISEDGSGWISVPASESNASSRRNPDDDGDLSPPRQRRKRADTPSPDRASRRNDDVNDDLSPPRRRTRHDSVETGDLSPPRRKSKIDADVSDDLSPPRRRKSRFDADVSDDLSPPRRGKSRSDADVSVDLSPPRRKTRHDSVETSDLSPPRRRKSDDASADMSPPRRRKSRFDADVSDDLSPPRRKTRHDSVEKSDLSPPRRRKSDDVSDDMSPPRTRKSRSDADVSDDLSPPRRRKSPAERVKQKGKEVGRRSGFFTKEEIEEEIKKKKDQERARMLLMDASVSGEGAEVIFRDKRGEKISREDMLKAKEKEKPKEEKPIAWGKGLAQKREAEARFLEMEKERNKPFARSRDDPELEKMLKETIRWGDPMAHLAKKKNMEPILEDLGDDERMKESGFIIPQTIPNHSWLKRGIDYPSNRYGIKPGRHWDGVDRSNGFEKELFKKKNEKRAMEQEAYLWSVSDM